MKKVIITILLAFISLTVVCSQEASFSAANQLYIDGKYDEAIKAYNSLLSEDEQSFEIYFNLGNCYFKLNDVPNSILFFEKAKKINPVDEDLNYNLGLANTRITDKFEKLPQINISKWYKTFLGTATSNSWATTSIILFIGCIISIAMFFYLYNIAVRRITLGAGIILLGLSIFTLFFAFHQKEYEVGYQEAVLFEPSVTVKSSPSESGTNLFVIHEGLKITVMEESNDWVKIKISDGSVGWMPKNFIKVI